MLSVWAAPQGPELGGGGVRAEGKKRHPELPGPGAPLARGGDGRVPADRGAVAKTDDVCEQLLSAVWRRPRRTPPLLSA